MIPVFKDPAARQPQNTIFNKYVSRIRVHSEHCMGAIKGRFQCLRGLRVAINCKEDHASALHWIRCAIILHNLVIDVDGSQSANNFANIYANEGLETDETGLPEEEDHEPTGDGEAKRARLVQELLHYRERRARFNQ